MVLVIFCLTSYFSLWFKFSYNLIVRNTRSFIINMENPDLILTIFIFYKIRRDLIRLQYLFWFDESVISLNVTHVNYTNLIM